MKSENYNAKAREAFAKSLIDIGVAILRGVVLLFILSPVTYIVKAGLDGRNASAGEVLNAIPMSMLFVVVVILAAGIFLGVWFRDVGVRGCAPRTDHC